MEQSKPWSHLHIPNVIFVEAEMKPEIPDFIIMSGYKADERRYV